MTFELIEAERAQHPVSLLCGVLGVTRSGFYAWKRRGRSKRSLEDEQLRILIAKVHSESLETYGVPRIHAELVDDHGIRVGRKRVARLMRQLGIEGVSRRGKRRYKTTIPTKEAPAAPDLVGRVFQAAGPNRLWVADITYVSTWEGFLFLACVIDAWSRRVVGWSMATHMRTELVTAALDAAVVRRRPGTGLIHHSDHGSQYTSLAFGRRLRESGIAASMGSVGDCYDNAMAESFFATLETELIDRSGWAGPAEAKAAVFEYIEVFYNRIRRHSSLGNLSPEQFEERYRSSPAVAAG
jgi:putative transposase